MSIFRADGVWPLADDQPRPPVSLRDEVALQCALELDAFHQKTAAERFHAACEEAVAERLREDLLLVLQETVDRLADRSNASSTTKKYLQHLTLFRKFAEAYPLPDGGHMSALPARGELVASWLLENLAGGKSHATLKVMASAVSAAHVANDHPDPCQSLLVRAVIKRARRFGKSEASDDVQPEAER